MNQFETFCRKFTSKYTYKGLKRRTLGLEKEIIAVDSKGSIAQIAEQIWPHFLGKEGFRAQYDSYYKDAITGFKVGGDLITLDAGKGTFEIVLQPYTTVRQAEIKMNKLLRILYGACEKEDIKLLGVGFQPRTRPDRGHWNRKQRYEVLIDVLKRHCYTASLSASDQVHIDVALDEVVRVTNVMNGLTGFMIALFANSPVRYGRCSNVRAYREIIWDDLSKIRTGVPQHRFSTLEDYLDKMWDLQCILAKKGNKFYTPGVSFREYVKEMPAQKTFNAFETHEGTIWFCARPRTFGTIEIRPACLQPWPDKMVVPAFVLGILENLGEAEMFLEDFRWNELRRLRFKTARDGIKCSFRGKPIALFVEDVLKISEKGLKGMKQGDERYLKPLWRRVKERKSPAYRSIAVYRKGGMEKFLQYVSLRKSHLN